MRFRRAIIARPNELTRLGSGKTISSSQILFSPPVLRAPSAVGRVGYLQVVNIGGGMWSRCRLGIMLQLAADIAGVGWKGRMAL